MAKHTCLDELAISQGYVFDEKRADRACKFFSKFLLHSKGSFAGKPFDLLPWQRDDVIRPLFGWVHKDTGLRRYRRAYIEIPKKNGKSTLCSGIALYLAVADNEAGSEVYLVAASRDQASIVFNESMNMINAGPLKPFAKPYPSKKYVLFPKYQNSLVSVLSTDADTAQGYNIHGLIFDEYHVQKTADFEEALMYGGAARSQPLQVKITTAGDDRNSPCYIERCYAESVAKGITQDLRYLPVIYCADDDDDWTKPETWFKANPSLGVTISLDSFEQDCKDAQNNPAKESAFRRYRLNQWVAGDRKWLNEASIAACNATKVDVPDGATCYIALDLATAQDTNVMVLYFPDYKVFKMRAWACSECLVIRDKQQKPKYDKFIKRKELTITEGKVPRYDLIRDAVIDAHKRYHVRKTAVDPYNATALANMLEDEGIAIDYYRPTIGNISGPAKEFQKMIEAGEISFDCNALFEWMAGNIVVYEDNYGNIRPVKKRSIDKIDGPVAAIMTIGLHMADGLKKFTGESALL